MAIPLLFVFQLICVGWKMPHKKKAVWPRETSFIYWNNALGGIHFFMLLQWEVLNVRPGKVDLQFIVKAFLKKRAGGRSFFIAKIFQFLRANLMKAIQKFVKIRKSVKNWMNLSIMKVEMVVSGVMQVVTINCESILPGLNDFMHSIRMWCSFKFPSFLPSNSWHSTDLHSQTTF